VSGGWIIWLNSGNQALAIGLGGSMARTPEDFTASIRACLRHHRWALGILLLLPIFVNAPALSGIFNNDPTLQFIGLGTALRAGLTTGQMSWLDPTVGYITQPLGHLVASDWAHGIVPWWNPYSGVGMPLAAEMQTAVFFLPFVLLLHWNCGWLLLRVLLQIGCGLFAYAFFVELKLRREAAVLGAALYGLSPIFYLSPHAAINTLPFLPLLLLGIQHAAKATREGRTLGWSLITIAVAYSILGGFPETAYLDGLFAAVWTLWLFSTLAPRLWLRFAGKLGLALAIALCLCAPLLIPFLEYLPHAYLGAHGGSLFTHARLEATLVPLQIFPFLYGPLDTQPPASIAAAFGGGWVRLPSWVSISVLALAIAALWRRGAKIQPRYILLFWVVLWEARYIGLAPAVWLVNLIPELATSDVTRFSGPMLAFSVFTLAAFGFDDYLEYGGMSRQRMAGAVGTIILVILAAIVPVLPFLFSWWEQQPFNMYIGCFALLAGLLITIFLCRELLHPGHKYTLLALLLIGPFYGLAYPQFAGFRGGKIDFAPVRFLQANLGVERMTSLGPLDLNFPARYGIASVNYTSMPAPMDWTNYISDNLFNRDLITYQGAAPGEQSFVMQHLPGYEALGVRYIVTRPGDDLIEAPVPLARLQLHKVPHALRPRVLLPDAGSFFDPQKGAYVPYAAAPDAGNFTGSISVALSSPAVSSVSVLMGTYRGGARGDVTLTLCTIAQCESATNDVALAKDNEPLIFQFPAPLTVPPRAELSYRFAHPDGTPVAVWLFPNFTQSEVPSFGFTGTDGKIDTGFVLGDVDDMSLVFKDDTAAIYRLSNTVPYASSPDAGCKVEIISRQALHSSCSAQGSVIRREMYFPGWSATVNGTAAEVSRSGLFQSITVPEGDADIIFSYAPPHVRFAFVVAMLAVLVWLGLVFGAAGFNKPKGRD
jgi:hypothetical protein